MRLVRSLKFRGWALLGAAALCIALPGVGYARRFGTCRRHPRRTQIADALQLGRLPAELPRLGQRGRHRDLGQPQGFRRIRARTRSRRRDHRAGFQRRFGQRFHRARTALARSRAADHRRHQRADPHRAGRSGQHRARSLLRIDVRVPAAVGQDALRARDGAHVACTRSGWATAPTMPRPPATPRRT